jgi:uncharacterized protein DUF1360
VSNLLQESAGRLGRSVAEYAPGQDRPLGGYAGAMSVYGALSAGLAVLARMQKRQLPRASASDIALVACATHKLARLIAKDAVTSPIRAPFTQFTGASGDAELAEEVRGDGVKHAVGELITCPFCLAQWLATGFTFGLIFAPRMTRLVAATMTAVAGSDFLQLAYAWGQRKAEG